MAAQIHVTMVRRSVQVRFDKIVRLSTYQPGEGGVAEHGLLLGLGEDDHPQYHTDERGDARYYRRGEVDAALASKADSAHGHVQLHSHANRATLDAIPDHRTVGAGHVLKRTAGGLEWGEDAQGDSGGAGDMLASVYDTDGDGTVDAAAFADIAPWDGISGKPAEFPPAGHDHAGVYEPIGEAAAQRAAHEAAFDHTKIGSDRGVSDHGALEGLEDDDHQQYHTDARGDARYSQLSHDHNGVYEPAGTAAAEVASHAVRSDNPHGVTANQAGAEPAGEAAAERAAHETAFDHAAYHAHLSDEGNPHAVTAHQLSYDNTSSGAAGANVQDAVDEAMSAAAEAYEHRVPAGGEAGHVLTRQSDGPALFAAPAALPGISAIGIITSDMTLHVAPDGDDASGDGTADNPWATPHKALDWLSGYVISSTAAVTIRYGEGVFDFGSYPLEIYHPQGAQIQMKGAGVDVSVLSFGTNGFRVHTALGNMSGFTLQGGAAGYGLIAQGNKAQIQSVVNPGITIDGFGIAVEAWTSGMADVRYLTIRNFSSVALQAQGNGYIIATGSVIDAAGNPNVIAVQAGGLGKVDLGRNCTFLNIDEEKWYSENSAALAVIINKPT